MCIVVLECSRYRVESIYIYMYACMRCLPLNSLPHPPPKRTPFMQSSTSKFFPSLIFFSQPSIKSMFFS